MECRAWPQPAQPKKQLPPAAIRDVQRDRENSHEVCPMALEITSTAREIGKLRRLAAEDMAKVAPAPRADCRGPADRGPLRRKTGSISRLFPGWQDLAKPPILTPLQ